VINVVQTVIRPRFEAGKSDPIVMRLGDTMELQPPGLPRGSGLSVTYSLERRGGDIRWCQSPGSLSYLLPVLAVFSETRPPVIFSYMSSPTTSVPLIGVTEVDVNAGTVTVRLARRIGRFKLTRAG
jgi:hypothetical protein